MKFKTNVMCNNCIQKITPFMDKVAGENNWSVDTKDPKRVLTVTNENISDEEVMKALQEAGYKSEVIG